ncbi:PilT/PilU family type 4a pilus ATPase [Patescibacteria group bacterium]|nr:MAG: PilT/PilU family type 4a pilus ATPase [Patescibacteria group bacterium]
MPNKEAPKIDELFAAVVKAGGSDLHLVSGREPTVRVDGKLVALKKPPLTARDIKELTMGMLAMEQQARFETERELDLAHQLVSGERFRVNLHWEKGAIGLAARLVPKKIPSPDELGLTEEMMSLAELPNGLVLLTGPAGSGKSTTLAAMLNAINQSRAENIITLEDPIEFLFPSGKSLVRQRELGQDMASFAGGLKHLLRQDPNIIMVGEMRDLETIATTLTLAETGHLVFATLHTNNAASTIQRVIDVFSPHQQAQVKIQLAMTLRAVISQHLLPRRGGGRVAAREYLLTNSAVANLIRENKPEQIPTVIQTSARLGMFTLEQDLKRLVAAGTVAPEESSRLVIKNK